MMVLQAVPSKVVETALDSLRSLGKDSAKYSIAVEDDGLRWIVAFLPLNPNRRGGDVKVRIAKDSLEVLEVLRYQ